jgi:hypothetical protein
MQNNINGVGSASRPMNNGLSANQLGGVSGIINGNGSAQQNHFKSTSAAAQQQNMA